MTPAAPTMLQSDGWPRHILAKAVLVGRFHRWTIEKCIMTKTSGIRERTLVGVFASAAAHAQSLLVLNKEGSVAIIDPATQKVLGRAPTGDGPHEVVATTDGKLAVASNYGSGQMPGHTPLSVIDIAGRKRKYTAWIFRQCCGRMASSRWMEKCTLPPKAARPSDAMIRRPTGLTGCWAPARMALTWWH